MLPSSDDLVASPRPDLRAGASDTRPTAAGIAPVTCLSVREVTKRFPGVTANEGVTFDVLAGSVHCLLGENGAGKSTLASMIYGVQRPDEGVIEHHGQVLHLRSPRDAIAAGIGMVHQHFELVGPMSTVENVAIGLRLRGRLRLEAVRSRLRDLCDDFGITLDLDAPVSSLMVGEQQWVEILKILYLGVDLLILDEPTAVLTPSGVEALFGALRRMRESGLAVILISHKMDEVLGISDRITVLRQGRVVDTVETRGASAASLTEMMVGRAVELSTVGDAPLPGAAFVRVEQVRVETPSGRGGVRGIDLEIRSGEILGVAGVSGNGQKALFDVLIGVATAASGRIIFDGVDVTAKTAAERTELGLGKVPSDRINEALVMDFKVSENLILGRHRDPSFARWGVLNRRAIEAFARQSIDSFSISTPSSSTATRVLSGGNMQKVVLARELSANPRVLLVDQPTRGLDIGASEYVRQQLIAERDRGTAVMVISEDLDELLALSTRLVVMHDGEVMATLDRADMNLERIGALMTGVRDVSRGES